MKKKNGSDYPFASFIEIIPILDDGFKMIFVGNYKNLKPAIRRAEKESKFGTGNWQVVNLKTLVVEAKNEKTRTEI